MLPFYKENSWIVKEIRCDAGSTENSQEFVDFLQAQNPPIKLSPSGVKEQQQNFVERANQTLTKGVGAILLDQYTLSNKRWDLAVDFWVKTRNITPNDKITDGDNSPLEMITGKPPDFSKTFRFPFGCPVIVHDPEGCITKFDVNNKYGIAVGHSDKGNGDLLVIIPSLGLSNGHRPVEVQQVNPLRLLQRTLTEEQKAALQPRERADGSIRFFSPTENEPSHPNTEAIPGSTLGFTSFGLPDLLPPSPSFPQEESITREGGQQGFRPPPMALSERSSRPQRLASVYQRPDKSYTPDKTTPETSSTNPLLVIPPAIVNLVLCDPISPTVHEQVFALRKIRTTNNPTIGQARKQEDHWHMWMAAILDELQMIKDKEVYDVIRFQDIPTNAQILNSKMDLKQKFNTIGEKIKYKARLVVLGNEEDPTDKDLYSPTVNHKALSLMLALSANEGMTLSGIDIKGFFLTAEIDEPAYMRLPRNLGEDPNAPSVYWKLKKTLYGLRRSPRLSNNELLDHLRTGGYKQSAEDQCLFMKRDPTTNKLIMFVVYVDDFAIASACPRMTKDLKDWICEKYDEIEDSETLEHFIGTHVEYSQTLESMYMHLSQPAHLQKIFNFFSLNDDTTTKHPTTPMSPTFELFELHRMDETPSTNSPRCDTTLYRSALGLLIFVLRTRPDVAFAVNHMSRRSTTCSEDDFQALKRIARYLHGTRKKTLRFKCNSPDQARAYTRLYAWCDASHANQQGSRSQTGVCFSLGHNGAMFYSKSKIQPTVSLSSAESETNAATDATCDIIWFRNILKELGFPQYEPTPLFSDNASMITLATAYSGNHKRVRHFMSKINFMIQQVQNSMVELIHLAGDDMPADVLTKPLGPTAHEKHTTHIMQGSINSPHLAALASCLSNKPCTIDHPKTRVHFPRKPNPFLHVQLFDFNEPAQVIPTYVAPIPLPNYKKSRKIKHYP